MLDIIRNGITNIWTAICEFLKMLWCYGITAALVISVIILFCALIYASDKANHKY